MITCDTAWAEAEAGAVELADESEFWRRTAISRIYYAVYHRAGLISGLESAGANSNHRRLLDHLRAANKKEWGRAAVRLEQLQRARVRADYYLGKDVTRRDVMTALDDARAVRQLLGAAADAASGLVG